MKIKKGDTVIVVNGDDKGERGTVKLVFPRKNMVIVSGVNMIKKHQRPTGSTRTQVGIIEREAPIHASNIALFCERCGRGVKTRTEVAADGSKMRLCRRCGEPL